MWAMKQKTLKIDTANTSKVFNSLTNSKNFLMLILQWFYMIGKNTNTSKVLISYAKIIKTKKNIL